MRRRRRYSSEEEQGGTVGEWMLTYSDLVTLLLTFFIMLFSMATVDKLKFDEVTKSLRTSFLKISNGQILNENTGKNVVTLEGQTAVAPEGLQTDTAEIGDKQLEDIKEKVQNAINDMELAEYVKVIDQKDELILRFSSVLLFDLGSAEIKTSGQEVLKKIGVLLKQLDNEILVQGHTDDLPIGTYLYPSNWELSTKRATNVVLYLINSVDIDPTKLTATGNGEFKPIAPNDSNENRQKNRRIDITIVK